MDAPINEATSSAQDTVASGSGVGDDDVLLELRDRFMPDTCIICKSKAHVVLRCPLRRDHLIAKLISTTLKEADRQFLRERSNHKKLDNSDLLELSNRAREKRCQACGKSDHIFMSGFFGSCSRATPEQVMKVALSIKMPAPLVVENNGLALFEKLTLRFLSGACIMCGIEHIERCGVETFEGVSKRDFMSEFLLLRSWILAKTAPPKAAPAKPASTPPQKRKKEGDKAQPVVPPVQSTTVPPPQSSIAKEDTLDIMASPATVSLLREIFMQFSAGSSRVFVSQKPLITDVDARFDWGIPAAGEAYPNSNRGVMFLTVKDREVCCSSPRSILRLPSATELIMTVQPDAAGQGWMFEVRAAESGAVLGISALPSAALNTALQIVNKFGGVPVRETRVERCFFDRVTTGSRKRVALTSAPILAVGEAAKASRLVLPHPGDEVAAVCVTATRDGGDEWLFDEGEFVELGSSAPARKVLSVCHRPFGTFRHLADLIATNEDAAMELFGLGVFFFRVAEKGEVPQLNVLKRAHADHCALVAAIHAAVLVDLEEPQDEY